MAALSGLTGLYTDLDNAPAGQVDDGAYQILSQGTPDPAHRYPGDSAGESWPAGYGLGYKGQGVYDGGGTPGEFAMVDGIPSLPSGGALDGTASDHGGLWPRPEATMISTICPDESLPVVGQQMRLLHGKEKGGSIVYLDSPGGHEEPVNITVDRYEAPDDNHLPTAPRNALRGLLGGVGAPAGGSHLGSADVDHGYGQLNSLPEFQHGHSIRIVQHDTLHFDRTLSVNHASEGTWLGKHPTGLQPRFDGPDSPYGVDGNFDGGLRAGKASTLGYPTEYAASPSPTVLPSVSASGSDVWVSGGF